MSKLFYVMIFIVSVLIASSAQIILKSSADKKHDSFLKEYLNLKVIIGYGMMFFSTILTILAYRKLEYKYGSIIESLGYIFMLLLSKMFLNEKITKSKVIGNIIIVFGIIIFFI